MNPQFQTLTRPHATGVWSGMYRRFKMRLQLQGFPLKQLCSMFTCSSATTRPTALLNHCGITLMRCTDVFLAAFPLIQPGGQAAALIQTATAPPTQTGYAAPSTIGYHRNLLCKWHLSQRDLNAGPASPPHSRVGAQQLRTPPITLHPVEAVVTSINFSAQSLLPPWTADHQGQCRILLFFA